MDDPIDFGPVIHIGPIDLNKAVSDLMTVTKVALGEDMPGLSEAEAIALLRRMLTIIDRTMPPELQAQDAIIVHLIGSSIGPIEQA